MNLCGYRMEKERRREKENAREENFKQKYA